MRKLIALLVVMLSFPLYAQVEAFTYTVGAVQITEKDGDMSIHTSPEINVKMLPGGHIWPRLILSEDGMIMAGTAVINSHTGRVVKEPRLNDKAIQVLPFGVHIGLEEQQFRIEQGSKACLFTREQLGLRPWKPSLDAYRTENIKFAASKNQLLALVAQLEGDSNADTYVVDDIQLNNCKIAQTKLGNPDLLVELNRSRDGGWWLTGSIEPTVLRSIDGKRWRKMGLPTGISSLISTYVVNDKEIWLAGFLPSAEDDDPLLVHTADGGKSWRNVRRGDPLLSRLPEAWLEGRRRVAMPVAR